MQAQTVLRLLSQCMIGLAVVGMLTGVCFLSSLMVLCQALLLLRVTSSSPKAFASEFQKLLQLKSSRANANCCAGDPCCHHCCSGRCVSALDSVRGLAVAGLTFAIIETLGVLVIFPLFGTFFISPQSLSQCLSYETFCDGFGQFQTSAFWSQANCNSPTQFTGNPAFTTA
jgi:hypothetical protein